MAAGLLRLVLVDLLALVRLVVVERLAVVFLRGVVFLVVFGLVADERLAVDFFVVAMKFPRLS